MSFRPMRRNKVGLATATSANGTTRTGATLDTDSVGDQGMLIECTATLTTSSVAATFTPQVSDDGTNWFSLKMPQAPAQVAIATGTGSPVTTRVALAIPASVKAHRLFRCNAVLAGATTDPADVTAVTYKWAEGFALA